MEITMTLTIAVQMDPLAGINTATDSSFAMMLEAQARGHTLLYYHPETVSYDMGEVTAHVAPVQVFHKPKPDHFKLGEFSRRKLSEFNVILLRQDPPFDMNYITNTHMLEMLPASTLVVNNPTSVRNCPEKIFVTQFADLMPPTMITRHLADVMAFRARHGDIVIKPLYGNAGASVFKVSVDDPNIDALVEMFQLQWREPFVVQKFMKEVSEGDKRIVLVDGEIGAVLNRVPAEGAIRANTARGAKGYVLEPTARDREICARIGPSLREKGFIIAGIDVIGGLMTEINVTSPTGMPMIRSLGGPDLIKPIIDAIERKFKAL